MSKTTETTSGLQAIVEEIKSLADRVKATKKVEAFVTNLQKAALRLGEARTRAQDAAIVARVLRKNKVTDGLSGADHSLEHHVREAAKVLSTTPEKFADGGVKVNELANRASAIAKTATGQFQIEWQNWCVAQYTPPDEALLTALQHVISLEKLRRLRQAVMDHSAAREQLPKKQADIKSFHTSRKEIDACLRGMDMPKEVLRFLTSVGSGAKLSLLTDAVLEWLKEQDLLERFHVVPLHR